MLSYFRDRHRRPILLEYRSSKTFIVATVAIAVFTDIFLYGVIVPVVPYALRSRVGIAADDVQYWISILLAVYGVFLLAVSPFWGWISDRTKTRRAPLMFGLVLLAGATALLAVGNSITLWIVGRALQGASGAVVWVTGLALLVDTVGKRDVGKYLGYVSLSLSLALLLAPLLGGVVYEKGGYEATFGMCFGMLGLDIFLRLVIIEKKIAVKWLGDDAVAVDSEPDTGEDKPPLRPTEPGEDSSAETVEPTHYNAGAQLPPPRISLARASSALSIKHLPPILILLKSRRLLTALYASLIQASLLTAFDSTLPLRVRTIFGWDSLGAGLIFLPIIVPSFIDPVIGWLTDKWGPRWFVTASFLLASPIVTLLRFVEHNSIGQKVLLCALLALFGFAVAIGFGPIMAEISYVVTLKEERSPGLFGDKGAYAQAYGLFNMAFAGGCIIGPLWAGMIQERAGWETMTWTVGLLAGTTALPAVLMLGGWIGGNKSSTLKALDREREAEKEKERGDVAV